MPQSKTLSDLVSGRLTALTPILDNIGLSLGLLDKNTYRGRNPDGSLITADQAAKQKPQLKAYRNEGLLSRAGEVAEDAVRRSPAGFLARAAAGGLAGGGYSGTPGADNSQEAQIRRARIAQTQAERARRATYEGRTADDPFYREGDPLGSAKRFTADALGMLAGGAVSDPTNLILPGGSLPVKIGAQAGISGLTDAALQGGELVEGTRDEFSPEEVALNAGVGAALPLLPEVPSAVAKYLQRRRGTPITIRPLEDLPEPTSVDPSEGFGDLSSPVRPPSRKGVTRMPVRDLHPDELVPPIPPEQRLRIRPEDVNPELAAQQRDRLNAQEQPVEGSPTRVEFPQNGRTADVNILTEEELRARLAQNGIDPEAIGLPKTPVEEAPAPGIKEETPPSPLEGEASPTSKEGPQEEVPPAQEAPAEIDTADVVSRLTQSLKGAQKLLPEQRALYREERSARLAKVREAQAATTGEEGFYSELSALKGELPKQDFEGVRGNFTQEEVDHLFDSVKTSSGLSTFGQISARTGLAKLLDGQLPTKSELSLLSRVFPPDFIQAALKKRSLKVRLLDAAGNALNLPRSLMSSFDLSAPFRQGLFLVNRKEFWKSFGSMFKAFGSERAYQGIMDDIRSRPSYDLMEESGLSIADLGHVLTDREEAFISNWAEKIPVIGRGVKMSERAYTGFLNKVRADTFDSILKLSEDAGISFHENPKALKDIASFVNAATGRGNLGKFSQAGPILNGLFFSPRLIASRVTLLNPAYYAQLSPVVRKEAVKSLLSLGAIATTITGLAAAGGLDVESDPRSSDFAKIKTGNTRYDILGGFGQYLTLGARLGTNETKTLKGEVQPLGKKFGQDNRLDVVTKFGISKFSPIASFIASYLRGKTYTGEPFDTRKEAVKLFIPLFLQDAAKVIQEQGAAKGLAMAAPGMFGVGVNTYEALPPAPTTIKVAGEEVELNSDARKQYQTMVQSYLDENIKILKDEGDWDKYSKDDQKALTAQIIKDGRARAKKDLFETPEPTETVPAPSPTPGQPLFEGFPGLPTSVRRTVEGNEKVGGTAHSDHLKGDAVDFTPPEGMTMDQLDAEARKYFSGMYVLNEGDHIHVRIPGLNGPLYGKKGSQ